jgi:hexaprenyl-diphosphate synthase
MSSASAAAGEALVREPGLSPMASAARTAAGPSGILPTQRRLSQITEMIHTASLLHDDVIDDADTRRGVRSINAVFGNKLAILGGDFMLARASLALAQLRNPDAVMMMSISIEHLVKGEVMQLKGSDEKTLLENVNFYLTKSFYKTASLMANSCRASMVVAGHAPESVIADAAYEYGKYAGLAFQIVDDLLDLTATADALGKPANHDLQQGLSTLPILYAAEEFPELHAMMARKFSHSDDVERAVRLVRRSRALERARALAEECASHAVAAVTLNFPDTPARRGLVALVERVLTREK